MSFEATLTDKQRGEFMKIIDEVTNNGFARAVVGAVIVAAGGTVTLTAEQILNAIEGNGLFQSQKIGTGIEISVRARPRCEKCGRWERHE